LAEQPSQQKDPNLIRVYDKYGRQLFVTKEAWRTDVLPGTIQANWDNPDQLYNLIIAALNDGFRADILEAATHLYDVDAERLRAANLWGIVLMEEGRLDEAEHVFNAFIRQHGESGVILTNLAKIFAKRGDEAKAERTLWHALEVDPNQMQRIGMVP
jgi:Flp pilus assembly protein TadD